MWKGERGTAISKYLHSKKEKAPGGNPSQRESAPLCPEHRDLHQHRTEGAFQRLNQGSGVVAMEVNYSVFFSSCAPFPCTSGNSNRFFPFVQELLWTGPASSPCTERLQCKATLSPNYRSGRFFISIPKIRLLFACYASTAELEPLAERGPFTGAPSYHGSQTHLLSQV